MIDIVIHFIEVFRNHSRKENKRHFKPSVKHSLQPSRNVVLCKYHCKKVNQLILQRVTELYRSTSGYFAKHIYLIFS